MRNLTELWKAYIAEQRELVKSQDPNTHRSEATMRRVYDRRRVITVDPLA